MPQCTGGRTLRQIRIQKGGDIHKENLPSVPLHVLAPLLPRASVPTPSLPAPFQIMASSSTPKSGPTSPKSSAHSRMNSTSQPDWVPDPTFYYELHTFQVRP